MSGATPKTIAQARPAARPAARRSACALFVPLRPAGESLARQRGAAPVFGLRAQLGPDGHLPRCHPELSDCTSSVFSASPRGDRPRDQLAARALRSAGAAALATPQPSSRSRRAAGDCRPRRSAVRYSSRASIAMRWAADRFHDGDRRRRNAHARRAHGLHLVARARPAPAWTGAASHRAARR